MFGNTDTSCLNKKFCYRQCFLGYTDGDLDKNLKK